MVAKLTLCILKRVLYVYLLWLTVSNLCALITVYPTLSDMSYGPGGGTYISAFYKVIMDENLVYTT